MANCDKSWRQRHRRLLILVGLLLLGAVIFCVIESHRDPWSRLYNEKQELDLYSGRARITWHRLYVQTGQEIRETPVSESLGSISEHASDEKWVTVYVFGFGGGGSPHFIYHGALYDVGTLAKYWERYTLMKQLARRRPGNCSRYIAREGPTSPLASSSLGCMSGASLGHLTSQQPPKMSPMTLSSVASLAKRQNDPFFPTKQQAQGTDDD